MIHVTITIVRIPASCSTCLVSIGHCSDGKRVGLVIQSISDIIGILCMHPLEIVTSLVNDPKNFGFDFHCFWQMKRTFYAILMNLFFGLAWYWVFVAILKLFFYSSRSLFCIILIWFPIILTITDSIVYNSSSNLKSFSYFIENFYCSLQWSCSFFITITYILTLIFSNFPVGNNNFKANY